MAARANFALTRPHPAPLSDRCWLRPLPIALINLSDKASAGLVVQEDNTMKLSQF
ncbi:hypothetical protein HPP92_021217 [Vanilla planifolia]|uniref:Uncharacterized protein n=1 Tax=Vanilla planifolia TaxID=51239 RepID=A0A835PYE9_VANPL|nr:hypothetical protein HPP92_021217 [Vanilla planifolia]